MRRMRSESWTFIWQPKVRMHAVLLPSREPGAGWGFVESFIIGALLILLLRLVDARPHGDLSGTAPQLELPDLEVARPRRPPKYIRHGAPFFLTEGEHGPFGHHSTRPLPPTPDLRPTPGDALHRRYLPAPHPLRRPQRYLQPEPGRDLTQPPRAIRPGYYVVSKQGGEDAGGGCVVEVQVACREVLEGGEEVGAGRARGGLQAAFGEGAGIEGGPNGGRGGSREDFGAQGGVLEVVEREAGPVRGVIPVVEDGAQVAGGDAWLEDQSLVGLRDAPSVVEDGEGSVAAVLQDR